MEPPPDKNYNALYDWCKERLLQLRSKTPEQLHATAPVYTIDAIFILGSLLRSSIDQSLVKPCQVVVDAARSAAERGEDVGAVYKESLAQHDAQWEGLVSWFMGETSRESFMAKLGQPEDWIVQGTSVCQIFPAQLFPPSIFLMSYHVNNLVLEDSAASRDRGLLPPGQQLLTGAGKLPLLELARFHAKRSFCGSRLTPLLAWLYVWAPLVMDDKGMAYDCVKQYFEYMCIPWIEEWTDLSKLQFMIWLSDMVVEWLPKRLPGAVGEAFLSMGRPVESLQATDIPALVELCTATFYDYTSACSFVAAAGMGLAVVPEIENAQIPPAVAGEGAGPAAGGPAG